MSFGLSVFGAPFSFKKPPILDITSGAISAYSMTKQLSSRAKRAFRLVRVSDLVELDIGFVNGLVNHAAATAFLGNSAGSIRTIYNQVTDSNHLQELVQAKQPAYSPQGAVFDGVDDQIFSNLPIYSLPVSLFARIKSITYDGTESGGLNNLISSAVGDQFVFRMHDASTAFGFANNFFVNNYPIIQGEDFTFSALISSGNSNTYKNGTLVQNTTVALANFQGIGFGARPDNLRFSNMLLDTAIIYSGIKASDRTKIEAAILSSGLSGSFTSDFSSEFGN